MVYRKYTRRVSQRRGRRTLSSYHIATRTSARSQAKQIYALKKRINWIQRRTKPEIITIQRSGMVSGNSIVTGSVSWIIGDQQTLGYAAPTLGPVVDITGGGVNSSSPNNFARLQSFTLYGNLQYQDETLTSSSVPETLRIVIVQLKTTRGTDLSSDDIFASSIFDEAANPFNNTFGPLQAGLSRTCKVLSDKRYTLSYQRPSVTIKTRIKYLLPFYRDTSSNDSGLTTSEPIPKGAIYVFFSKYSQSRAASSTLNLMYKLAYTDA